MVRWARAWAAVVILLGSVWATPAAGQETVEFRLRLTRGETIYHAFTASGQISIQAPNGTQTTGVQLEGRQATRVLEVDPDGTALLELVLEDFRVRQGEQTAEPIDEPIVLRVRPDGRVVERRVGEYEGEDFPFGFPGRAVRVGETWTRQTKIDEVGITGEATQTFTLAGVEGAGPARAARVTYRTEGKVSGADVGTPPPGTQSRVSGTIQGSGEVLWSVTGGRPLRNTDDLVIETRVELSGQGQTVTVMLTFRSATRREPLAPERVSAAPVSAEFLIAPGKAVGTVGLDLPASELTTRLGPPQARGVDVGLRAPALTWPNGLVGYVDSADQTKLVGLEIADRRFRTDKGITFGSSEGAVLLTYGSSPARVNLTIPNLGGARVLVYNDLGIAFAITADKQHADAGPEHAPLGAVDWITIFSPGQAGRIYALP